MWGAILPESKRVNSSTCSVDVLRFSLGPGAQKTPLCRSFEQCQVQRNRRNSSGKSSPEAPFQAMARSAASNSPHPRRHKSHWRRIAAGLLEQARLTLSSPYRAARWDRQVPPARRAATQIQLFRRGACCITRAPSAALAARPPVQHLRRARINRVSRAAGVRVA